jgi:hypothetical protein
VNRERDDDGPWCESCGRVMLDTEDPEDWFDGVCQECDRDEAPTHDYPEDADPLAPSRKARTEHCREEAHSDLFEIAAELTRNYAALLRRTG